MNINKQLALSKAIAEAGLSELAVEAGIKIADHVDYALAEFITVDPDTIRMKKEIKILANENTSVLILGESGTGKEILAKALHANRKGEFIAINCAGIPDELLEAEFFGSVKGSYTGSINDRSGLVQQADEGTLFLDEIGDMPLFLQSKLLRFLETRKYRRIGWNREITSNCRIVSATNQDICKLIERKKFRLDLYYRLAEWEIYVKPLRQRKGDIAEICKKYNVSPIDVNHFNQGSWAGNVRQLLSTIKKLRILNKLCKYDASLKGLAQ